MKFGVHRLFVLLAASLGAAACNGGVGEPQGNAVVETDAEFLVEKGGSELGYIVEFSEPPTARKSRELQGMTHSARRARLQEHKRALRIKRDRFTTAMAAQLSAGVVRRQFDTALNGISVEGVDREELEAFFATNFPGEVTRISLNVELSETLAVSVPHIGASEVWERSATGPACDPSAEHGPTACLTGTGITIGILDSGIDYNHPDLGGCLGPGCKVVDGYDFINDDNDPMDDRGHGTHVAATAAGKGALLGVAPDAQLVAYKVLDESGYGPADVVIEGIEASIDPDGDGDPSDHLDVINLSLGTVFDASPDDAASTAVDSAVDAGVVVVISAGNSGPSFSTVGTPGMAREAITVGASCLPEQVGVHSDCDGHIALFSSRGPTPIGQLKPDVSAPGVAICAAQAEQDQFRELILEQTGEDILCHDDSHIALKGTSMAGPHVAGVAALLLQARPGLKPLEVKSLLRHTASPLTAGLHETGHGLIDALAAIESGVTPAVLSSEVTHVFPTDDQVGLIYQAHHGHDGLLVLEKATTLDVGLQNVAFTPVWSSEFVPPSEAGLELISLDQQPAIAEIYKVALHDDMSGELFTDYSMVFRSPPNSLEGWPLVLQGSQYCFGFGGMSAGRLRDAQSADVFIKYGGAYCELFEGYVYNHQAEDVEVFPHHTHDLVSHPLTMDLDGDGLNELIHDDYTFDAALNELEFIGSSLANTAWPMVTDLNGDGELEIVRLTPSSVVLSTPPYDTLTNFAFEVDHPSVGQLAGGLVAIGDLDNDGNKEIVSNTLEVLSFTGTGYETKPYQIDAGDTDERPSPYISLGDLDRDGWVEVIQVSAEPLEEGDELVSIQNVNIYERGVRVHSTAVYMANERGHNEIVLGDFVGDHKLEILLSDESRIVMLDYRGELIREVEHESFSGSGGLFFYVGVYTHDVDGDGKLEILKTRDHVWVYDGNLELVDTSFPLYDFGSQWNRASNPFFVDLDGDGTLDLITSSVGGLLASGVLTVYAWDLTYPAINNGDAWLRPGYDEGRTSCYRCDQPVQPNASGDANGDGLRSFADLTTLLGCWGSYAIAPPCAVMDLSGDGVIGFSDLTMMLGQWGVTLEPQCSDGLDNDFDGRTDYPAEDGCASVADNDESNCGDGVCEGGENGWACSLDCCIDSDADWVCDAVDQCDGDDARGDHDDDGVCDDRDLCDGFDGFGDSDGDGICDTFQCDPTELPFVDQHGSPVEWVAVQTCLEQNGEDGPLGCPAAQWAQHIADIEYVLQSYSFASAIIDENGAPGQNFTWPMDSIFCIGLADNPAGHEIFAEIDSCYHGSTSWNASSSVATVQFEMAVNIWEMRNRYGLIASEHGGSCYFNPGTNVIAKGFHAQDDSAQTRWEVTASNCPYTTCSCEASMTLYSTGDGSYTIDSQVNGSNALCTDELFLNPFDPPPPH